MDQNFKFHSSSRFCFECGFWKDRNENGFGTCTSPGSVFHGNEVPAMNKCTPKEGQPSSMDYEVQVIRDGELECAMPQPGYEDARLVAKSLAMDEVEALGADGKPVSLEQVHSADGRLCGFFISIKEPYIQKSLKTVSVKIHKLTLVDRITEQVLDSAAKTD